ncbi:hypothetical protein GLOIN_2v1542857 [Rhizophagus clarus]|uniref:Uncharacterized protein n=1 Tax=Rhizophagus clarus TaxID=94130 RepID=A0A8H3QGG4_9GLOM|nr:hypothetical protein GLOIN_2v1542857 [Rhizophagus clarus]
MPDICIDESISVCCLAGVSRSAISSINFSRTARTLTIHLRFGYGNNCKAKKILIKKIDAYCGEIVDSIQFTYRIETINGPYELLGNKYGKRVYELDDKLAYTFTDDEQVTGISGRTTLYIVNMGILLWKKFCKQKAVPVPPLVNN